MPAAMATAEAVGRAPKRQKRHDTQLRGPKLPLLPPHAQVRKRPLLRPPLPSPYANSSAQKVVYVGSRTPFLSAVKRVERLLQLSDQRLMQSAARLVQNASHTKQRRRREDDELAAAAKLAEEEKRAGGEEVVVKGSGKAITKVLEMALWFQQREHEYGVRLETSSTSSIDDVEYRDEDAAEGDVTEETRIRKVSVLEVWVRLR